MNIYYYFTSALKKVIVSFSRIHVHNIKKKLTEEKSKYPLVVGVILNGGRDILNVLIKIN